MNKIEAWTEMFFGKKITHRLFSPDEYIHIVNGKMLTEDGYRFEDGFNERDTEEWQTGWSILK